jgi:hypothetical protein
VVAFGRVVVHHVQNDLDARGVQPLHHGLEFGNLPRQGTGPGRIPHVGSKEADGVVAPVVRESLLGQATLADHMMDRQQLERGNSQTLQVIEDRVGCEAEISPAQLLRHFGVPHRHALDMTLVDNSPSPRSSEWPLVPPAEPRLDDEGLGHPARTVLRVQEQIPIGILAMRRKSGEGTAPLQGSAYRLGVRIEQQLCRVEAPAFGRGPPAVHPVAVCLSGSNVGKVRMPDASGLFPQLNAPGLDGIAGMVEQTELHGAGTLGAEREVGALAIPVGSQRRR